MVVIFFCLGDKRFNSKCMEPFLQSTEAKYGMMLLWQLWHLKDEISLQSYWSFHEMFQTIRNVTPKMTFFWKAYQNIVAANTMVVDESIYATNEMLSYTVTVSGTIIHETQNLLPYFLLQILIMYTQPLFSEKIRHFIIVSLASLIFHSFSKSAVFSPIILLGLVRCVNLVTICSNSSNFQ